MGYWAKAPMAQEQMVLISTTLDDRIPEDHPVRLFAEPETSRGNLRRKAAAGSRGRRRSTNPQAAVFGQNIGKLNRRSPCVAGEPDSPSRA